MKCAEWNLIWKSERWLASTKRMNKWTKQFLNWFVNGFTSRGAAASSSKEAKTNEMKFDEIKWNGICLAPLLLLIAVGYGRGPALSALNSLRLSFQQTPFISLAAFLSFQSFNSFKILIQFTPQRRLPFDFMNLICLPFHCRQNNSSNSKEKINGLKLSEGKRVDWSWAGMKTYNPLFRN